MIHIKKIILLIFALSSASIMQAQDYIKEFVGFHSDTSIVRSISADKFLLYSNNFPHSSFILVSGDVTTGTVPVLHLNDYTYIKDFHIYGDMVYFCGFETSGQSTEAIVGYFNMASFPSCQVYYYIYSTALSFNKLDIYEIPVAPFERHVIMTATVSNSESSIVDAYPYSSSQWLFERSIMLPITEVFDDVTSRDSTVAFSSRSIDNIGQEIGEIWFFSKPTVSGTTIFSTNLYKKTITNPVPSSPIWMEKCPGDKLAITYGSDNNRYLIVSSMDMVAGISIVMIDFRFPWLAKDIKFNSFSKELEVMVTKKPYNLITERLFRFPQHMFDDNFFGGNSFYHEYRTDIDRLCSFDYLSSLGGTFIVSGYDKTVNILCFYRYAYNIWRNCTQKSSEFAVPLYLSCRTESDYLPLTSQIYLDRVKMDTRFGNIDYNTVCR